MIFMSAEIGKEYLQFLKDMGIQRVQVKKIQDLALRHYLMLKFGYSEKDFITVQELENIVNNKEIVQKDNFPTLQDMQIQNKDFSHFASQMQNNAKLQIQMQNNAKDFEILIEAVKKAIDLRRPNEAIPILALYTLPSHEDGKEKFYDRETIEDKTKKINQSLGNRYTSTTLSQAISRVLNNTDIVQPTEIRKTLYYRLLDDVRRDIDEQLMVLLQREQLKEAKALADGREREEMIRAFADFFKSYSVRFDGKDKLIYRDKIIEALTTLPIKAIDVDWKHLNAACPNTARAVLKDPEEALLAAQDGLRVAIEEIQDELGIPEDSREVLDIQVRFYNLPETLMPRQIGSNHINRFIQVEGVVSRISAIQPFVRKAVFVCKQCGHEMIRIQKPFTFMVKPSRCTDCGSKDMVLDEDKSEFVNAQRIRIQDKPEQLSGGELPRHVDAIVLGDLVDKVRPGDRITLVGILRLRADSSKATKLPIKEKALIVNNIISEFASFEDIEITPEDEMKIKKLAQSPTLIDDIIDSIAPATKGMKEVKLGLALALFGGVPVELPDGTWLRGDIHILLVGDPGTAKSTILAQAASKAPRSIYTSAPNSTGKSLIAVAVRDDVSGGWIIEAGVLTIADGGFAFLDELDKMSEEDRNKIHEAMEQQRVGISKGGITTIINTRTTVIAAANPKHGRFNRYKPIVEQIKLPPTILSRFDLIFTILDDPDDKKDREIFRHIAKIRSGDTEVVKPKISPELLRKYVAYARKHVFPRLSKEAEKELEKAYLNLRNLFKKVLRNEAEGMRVQDITTATARQAEALIRLAQAAARMRLSDVVTVEDARVAIMLMEFMYNTTLRDPETGLPDVNYLVAGVSSKVAQYDEIVKDVIVRLYREKGEATYEHVLEKVRQEGLTRRDLDKILEILKKEGEIMEIRADVFIPTLRR